MARLKNLLDRGLIPREQYETQVATAAALKATTDADRAAVAAAEMNLQYTTHHRAGDRPHRARCRRTKAT